MIQKRIFCSGPYTADDFEGVERNLDMARAAVKDVLLAGHVPVCPHLITAYLDLDPDFEEWDHTAWLEQFCYPLMDRCDAIYLYPGWEKSKGAVMEKAYAEKTGKEVLFYVAPGILWPRVGHENPSESILARQGYKPA